MGFLIAQVLFLLINETIATTVLLVSYLRGEMGMFWYMVVLLIILGLLGSVAIIDFLRNKHSDI